MDAEPVIDAADLACAFGDQAFGEATRRMSAARDAKDHDRMYHWLEVRCILRKSASLHRT